MTPFQLNLITAVELSRMAPRDEEVILANTRAYEGAHKLGAETAAAKMPDIEKLFLAAVGNGSTFTEYISSAPIDTAAESQIWFSQAGYQDGFSQMVETYLRTRVNGTIRVEVHADSFLIHHPHVFQLAPKKARNQAPA